MSNSKLQTLSPDAALPQSSLVQFFQKLKIAVTAGYWRPDEFLPSSLEFAGILGLEESDITLALEALERDHWIARCDKGYRITPKIDQPVSSLSSLSDMLRARGFSAGSIWLKRELSEPSLDEQCRLHLQTGIQVARLERLRTAGDIIIGYECTAMPATFVADPNQIGDSLYQFMEEHDLHISRASEEIEAYSCDNDMAQLCQLKPGHPMLRLTRIGYLANGRALELSHSFFRSDYYRYVVELNN